jgi:signal transduction histidine kinase
VITWAKQVSKSLLQLKLRILVPAGLVGLPLILIAIVLLLVQQMARSDENSAQIAQSNLVRNHLRGIYLFMVDAESSERGYLLTGKESFLASYNKALVRMPPSLANFRATVKKDPVQRAELAYFERIATRKMQKMGEMIALRRQGRGAQAIAMLQPSADKLPLADVLFATSVKMHAIEKQRMARLLAERDDMFRRTTIFVSILVVALILFLAFGIAMLLANIRENERVITAQKQSERERAHLTDQLSAEKERLLATVAQLAAAKTEADNANRAKSEFLASMSHELRTPLNAILGFSEVIKDQMFGPVGHARYAEYAGDVHKSGQHLLDLINDVLDLSKIDAGKMELHEENFAVADLIEDASLLVRDRARGKVDFSVAPCDSVLSVTADRRLVKQIILNLLTNAIKFTPPGGSVTIAAQYQLGRDLRITVTDSGIGMSEVEIERALQPYGQIDSKIARDSQGTGLGLPIARQLARLHGGDLVVRSQQGVGTVTALILPESRVQQSLLRVG